MGVTRFRLVVVQGGTCGGLGCAGEGAGAGAGARSASDVGGVRDRYRAVPGRLGHWGHQASGIGRPSLVARRPSPVARLSGVRRRGSAVGGPPSGVRRRASGHPASVIGHRHRRRSSVVGHWSLVMPSHVIGHRASVNGHWHRASEVGHRHPSPVTRHPSPSPVTVTRHRHPSPSPVTVTRHRHPSPVIGCPLSGMAHRNREGRRRSESQGPGATGSEARRRPAPSYDRTMPLYEYRCRTCESTFEARRSMSDANAPAECPDGHVDSMRLLSMFASVGAGSASAQAPRAAAPSGGGGCGAGCGCAH